MCVKEFSCTVLLLNKSWKKDKELNVIKYLLWNKFIILSTVNIPMKMLYQSAQNQIKCFPKWILDSIILLLTCMEETIELKDTKCDQEKYE